MDTIRKKKIRFIAFSLAVMLAFFDSNVMAVGAAEYTDGQPEDITVDEFYDGDDADSEDGWAEEIAGPLTDEFFDTSEPDVPPPAITYPIEYDEESFLGIDNPNKFKTSYTYGSTVRLLAPETTVVGDRVFGGYEYEFEGDDSGRQEAEVADDGSFVIKTERHRSRLYVYALWDG
ncbi:MAG: hypothetical protein K6G58_07855, partial [Lachnospiraceae bacterium]|nr:hypothetical protein [Lachnospiraceae bacterium]